MTIDIFKLDIGRPCDQRLAGIIVKPLCKANNQPNAVTLVGPALSVAYAYAFIFGLADLVLRPQAALMFILAVFVDHMDGELARMSGKTIIFGHYLD